MHQYIIKFSTFSFQLAEEHMKILLCFFRYWESLHVFKEERQIQQVDVGMLGYSSVDGFVISLQAYQSIELSRNSHFKSLNHTCLKTSFRELHRHCSVSSNTLLKFPYGFDCFFFTFFYQPKEFFVQMYNYMGRNHTCFESYF